MRVTRHLIALMVSGALTAWGGRTLLAAEWATDETIESAFRRSHNVMTDQQTRLQGIMNGFLTSDTAAIERQAGELVQAMQQVMVFYPPASRNEAEQWGAIAEIIKDAAQLKTLTAEGKYQQAYVQYSALIGRCIACHQARRTWGLFTEPLPAATEEPAPPAGTTKSPTAKP